MSPLTSAPTWYSYTFPMSLVTYKKKRNFKKTSEPAGKLVKKATKKVASFVIQKHAASHLHYDFRLEVDGVLKSWAVPKGPSLNPIDKRLAVEVEDHPIEYGSFEGAIPQGEYGGGNVIIWDQGNFSTEMNAAEAIKKGKLEFSLKGEKLNGGFVLVRLPQKASGKPNWLLMKSTDKYAIRTGDVTKESPDSVVSGLSVEAIGAATTVSKKRRVSGSKKQK